MKHVAKIFGVLLLVAGFAMLGFSMWQLNMLTSPMVDGDTTQSIAVFRGVESRGYTRFRDVPWTINSYLFPNMTAGLAYDGMMMVNFASAVPIMAGTYLLLVRGRRKQDSHVDE
jgi:hypothetical protein